MVGSWLLVIGHSIRSAFGAGSDPAADRRVGIAAVSAAGLVGLAGGEALPLSLALVGLTVGIPGLRRRRAARAERDAVERELVSLLALLRLACGAGLGTRAGLAAVAPWVPGVLGDELTALTRRVERGRPLIAELDSLALRWGGVLAPTCRGLLGSERHGAPLMPVLARLDEEASATARRRQEEAIRGLPVRLLLPLACTILPAFVLLAVVPLVASTVATIAGS